MKRLNATQLLAAVIILFASCGYPGPPKPPSLNLPQPVSDLSAVRKGDNVYLNWTAPTETTDSLPVRHLGLTRICRNPGSSMSDCSNLAGKVPAPAVAKPGTKERQAITDSLSADILGEDPAAQLSYAVSVENDRGRSAGISNVVSVPAIVAPKPPADFRAEVTAAGVVVQWEPIAEQTEISKLHRAYRIYRREQTGAADTVVGDAAIDSSELVDRSFDWEKTYLYRACVVTTIHLPDNTEREFEGDDTIPVKLFAHDVFPPAVPSGLQSAFSGEGQQRFIDLIWVPDTDVDLAGYNVYRQEEGGASAKINSQPVKTPSFRDAQVASGHRYIYSVTALDVRGNESSRSNETSEAVP